MDWSGLSLSPLTVATGSELGYFVSYLCFVSLQYVDYQLVWVFHLVPVTSLLGN